MRESQILADIRAALNRDGRCRVVRYSVGFDATNRVRYGMPGWPDLIGVLRDGRAFCIEVKAPHGRLSTDQAAFWVAAHNWNVAGGVARSVEEAMALLEAACSRS
jgi:hypothetical protein